MEVSIIAGTIKCFSSSNQYPLHFALHLCIYTVFIKMKISSYDTIPQEETGIDSKEQQHGQPTTEPLVSKPRNHVLYVVVAILVCSLTANLIFFHRQFIRPWDLNLPSRYGTYSISHFTPLLLKKRLGMEIDLCFRASSPSS